MKVTIFGKGWYKFSIDLIALFVIVYILMYRDHCMRRIIASSRTWMRHFANVIVVIEGTT